MQFFPRACVLALCALILVTRVGATIKRRTIPDAGARGLSRHLLVSIDPDAAPKSEHLDPSVSLGTEDIPASDARVQKRSPGCREPEQVHLTYWNPNAVLVSWATCDAVVGPQAAQTAATADPSFRSEVVYGPTDGSRPEIRAPGITTTYLNDYEPVGQPSYASPRLHHVVLRDLEPGKAYTYKITGDGPDAVTRAFNFTAPTNGFPFRLGVMADPGQTYNTSVMLDHLISSQPQLAVLAGDFVYADQWASQDQRITKALSGKFTYQPKWDMFGRLFEPLLSVVPLMHTNGNHEIEQLPDGRRNNAYNHRYPVPTNKYGPPNPTSFPAVTTSDPYNNLYYSVEVPGVFKYIFLTSYSPGQVFDQSDEQYKWLEKELRLVDRTKTPWLLVTTHAPWYNTYKGHYKENECMRQVYEPLLVKYSVDILVLGHIHSYERTKPVVNYEVNEAGPVHITMGDGGNIEGLYKDFIDEVQASTFFCAHPENYTQFPSYQPQACLSFQQGQYCPTSQPAWSAYREPSFGHGVIDFANATHAFWTWHKNQWPEWQSGDQVTIIRR